MGQTFMLGARLAADRCDAAVDRGNLGDGAATDGNLAREAPGDAMSLQSGPPIILASQSPYRAGLLVNAGLRFTALPAYIDEAATKRRAQADDWTPEACALSLARQKAAKIATDHWDAMVIGADQLLICGNDWFDKPRDLDEARSHLQRLRGRTHVLVTAVVAMHGGIEVWDHVARPALTMRNFSDSFLETYLTEEAGHLTTTVGAYRLEGQGIHLFENIEGDHSSIIGLPLLPLLGFLRNSAILM